MDTPVKRKKGAVVKKTSEVTPTKFKSSARRRCYSRAYHTVESLLKHVPGADVSTIAKKAAQDAVAKFLAGGSVV